jgi:hypothetical protein
MGAWKKMLLHVAWSGFLLSIFPGVIIPLSAQESALQEQRDVATPDANPSSAAKSSATKVEMKAAQPEISELPDSPSASAAKAANSVQQPRAVEQRWEIASAAPQSALQPAPAQSSSTQQEAPPQRPVGTAAAEAPNASGIAASQPAGVAIAPAKQRRVRTIVLRTGAIIAAGVAVGSVVALTAGTSSKPPGAH